MEVVRASVDRFEEDYAVIYSDDGTRFDVHRDRAGEARPGDRVSLTIESGSVVAVEVDVAETDEARKRIKRKYERVRRGGHLG